MKKLNLNNKIDFPMKKLASALSVLSVSFVSLSANAQEKSFSLEEVVVTATRQETALQQTAVAVSAFSSEALSDKGVTTMQQLDNFVPSLSIGNRAGFGAAAGSITLRGIGVDGFESDGAVGTYVDDVFYGAQFGNLLGMMDLARVEVLRGPQGTVFGRNTLAGAIQYISAQPDTDEFYGYVKGAVGTDERQDFSFAVNLPVTDTLAFRVAGTTQEKDGWVKDIANNVNLGAEENDAFRILAAWQPTDSLSATFKYETVESSNNGRAAVLAGYENDALFAVLANLFGAPLLDDSFLSTDFYSTPGGGLPESFDFEMDIYQATFEYVINDYMSIKSITAYQDYTYSQEVDFDISPIPLLSRVDPGKTTTAFSQEFRLEGSALDDKLNYTVGLFYYEEDAEANPNNLQLNGPLIPGINEPRNSGETINNTESMALYAQVAYNLTDVLTMTVGLRQTDEDVVAENNAPGLPPTKFESSYTETSPYLGLDYQINDDMMVYLKYSEGFRAGGATAAASLPGGGIEFDQDTVETIELGGRFEFMDGRLRVNPTLYQTDWSGVQVNDVVPSATVPVISTNNIGDAEITGLELDSLYAVTEELTLNVSLSVMDSKYTRLDPYFQATYPNGLTFGPMGPVGTVLVPNLTKDSELNRAPELKYTIGATYKHALSSGAEISSSLSYSYTDEQRSTTPDLGHVPIDDYALVNGRLQFTSSDEVWSVAVLGTNLTDEEYLTGGNNFANGYTIGVLTVDPARGREVALEVQYNF